MYQLKSTSASAKFYKWIWGSDVTKFKTMCPYFWKYVLTILFLPIILFFKLIGHLIPKSEKVEKAFDYIGDSKVGDVVRVVTKPSKFWNIVGKILKWIFFIGIGIILVGILIGLIIAFWSDPKGGFSIIGAIVVVLGIIIGIGYIFDEYSLGRKIGAPFRLFGTMINSLYHNLCPLINWK